MINNISPQWLETANLKLTSFAPKLYITILSSVRKFRLLLMPLLLASSCFVSAQHIEKLYINMPEMLNPLLTTQQRHELLEYYKASQGDSITNRFGNQSRILILDTLNMQIKVQNSTRGVFDMKLLPLPNKTMAVGIIRTFCGPICHSAIEFYDTAWHKMDIKFVLPSCVEWLDTIKAADNECDIKWMERMLSTNFVQLAFGETNTIVAQNNCLAFLCEADRLKIQPCILPKPFVYTLTETQWQRKP